MPWVGYQHPSEDAGAQRAGNLHRSGETFGSLLLKLKRKGRNLFAKSSALAVFQMLDFFTDYIQNTVCSAAWVNMLVEALWLNYLGPILSSDKQQKRQSGKAHAVWRLNGNSLGSWHFKKECIRKGKYSCVFDKRFFSVVCGLNKCRISHFFSQVRSFCVFNRGQRCSSMFQMEDKIRSWDVTQTLHLYILWNYYLWKGITNVHLHLHRPTVCLPVWILAWPSGKSWNSGGCINT